MPAPTRRNHVSDNGSHTESSADRGASLDLIEEAETLRAMLQEASARSARLIAALKQQRRQSRAVQQAVASLRQLQIDR